MVKHIDRVFLLLSILFISGCGVGCKPITRQEPVSKEQIAFVVNTFRQLLDSNAYKAAREFITAHLNKNNKHLAGEAIRKYLQNDNTDGISNFLRSYTHSYPSVVRNKEIDDLAASIATSNNEQEVVELLAQVDARAQQIKSFYVERNRALTTIRPREAHNHGLIMEARDDFAVWIKELRGKLLDNLEMHRKRIKSSEPYNNSRSMITKMLDDFEGLYLKLGIPMPGS